LTQGAGSHDVAFNADRSLFLDTTSSLASPPAIRLCNAEGEVLETLARSDIPDLERFGFRHPELVQIPARDGFLMDATILWPPDFDSARAHPVWLATYSGPNAPSVRDRWNADAWFQFLAQQGIVVFQVNNRSSSGRGRVTTESCYENLGVGELADLEDAVEWLCRKPGVDPARVGITGWSYGGFMTAFALTHSDRFCLGIAGAGVYDWRDYDTIYTERFMRMPQNNVAGYERTSCVESAAGLTGHLLLVHGTMDDNVHLQNTIQFVYALQKADKSFELMLYPRSRHRIAPELRWHQRQLEWRTIEEHLLGRAGPG
jgi:dipeptidyl-peptidase-4